MPFLVIFDLLERKKNMIDYKNELNPQQLEAVTTINGPVAINAGPGSG